MAKKLRITKRVDRFSWTDDQPVSIVKRGLLPEPRCHQRNCVHFIGAETPDPVNRPEVDQILVCEAFPKGIPTDISYGINLHLKPVKGDGGIRYENADPEKEFNV